MAAAYRRAAGVPTMEDNEAEGRHRRGAAMLWVRRLHLYLGLLLLPWAVLYAVTALLFNHPTWFSDQELATFGRGPLAGTPLETPPSPAEMAAEVVAALNHLRKPARPYALLGGARFSRDFAFATANADGRRLSILLDIGGGGGTIHAAPAEKKADPAPFAVGGPPPVRGRAAEPARPPEAIRLADPLPERVRASAAAVLASFGHEAGAVTVTSVPDLVFTMEADGVPWRVTYNATAGSVSGVPADQREGLSVRRFLTRLHLAHGYPHAVAARWFWAALVDVMAGVMLFWGVSGLLMWWQIKTARWPGAVTLVVSAALALTLGWAMHSQLTP